MSNYEWIEAKGISLVDGLPYHEWYYFNPRGACIARLTKGDDKGDPNWSLEIATIVDGIVFRSIEEAKKFSEEASADILGIVKKGDAVEYHLAMLRWKYLS